MAKPPGCPPTQGASNKQQTTALLSYRQAATSPVRPPTPRLVQTYFTVPPTNTPPVCWTALEQKPGGGWPSPLWFVLLLLQPDQLPKSRLNISSSLSCKSSSKKPCSAALHEIGYDNNNLTIHLEFNQDMEWRRSCLRRRELLEKSGDRAACC